MGAGRERAPWRATAPIHPPVALPAGQLPFALASFNVGVEAGQVAVLAIVLPLVSWLAGCPWFARGGLQATSAAISAAGLWWFVARITSG